MVDERGRNGGNPEGRIEREPRRAYENPQPGDGSAGLKKILDDIKGGGSGAKSSQSLAAQLYFCMETRKNLADLQGELVVARNNVANLMQELVNQNYIDELREKFAPFVDEFDAQLRNILGHLDEKHIGYLTRQADSLTAALQRLSRET